jgi:hypothetical protein
MVKKPGNPPINGNFDWEDEDLSANLGGSKIKITDTKIKDL